MLSRRPVFFLLLAVVSGVAGLIAYRSSAPPEPVAPAELVIETEPMILAGEDLPAGVVISPTQLHVAEWPSAYFPNGGIQERGAVANRIPRRPIAAGEPIMEQMLLPEGRLAGLTALIETNHRAVSVEADAVVGVGGFIRPGSRVDVLAQLKDVDRQRGSKPFSRTILQNVKVLAIDQDFEQVGAGEPTLASVVTLEVDPAEAQVLAYAAAEGKIHLSLRNEVDSGLASLRSTGPQDFFDEIPALKPGPQKNSIDTIRGSEVTRKVL